MMERPRLFINGCLIDNPPFSLVLLDCYDLSFSYKKLFRKSVSLTVIVTTTHKPVTAYPFFAFTESLIELDIALFLISHLIKLMQVKYFHIFIYFLQLVSSKVMARAIVSL